MFQLFSEILALVILTLLIACVAAEFNHRKALMADILTAFEPEPSLLTARQLSKMVALLRFRRVWNRAYMRNGPLPVRNHATLASLEPSMEEMEIALYRLREKKMIAMQSDSKNDWSVELDPLSLWRAVA